MVVGLMRILLGQKMKKKLARSIQLLQMDGEDLKQ
jgi:DNA-directed RNA polymerase specialized sigma54-like protein